MSVSPDIRKMCDGSKPFNNLSMGCFGQYHEAFDNVYIMNNVTKVANYITSSVDAPQPAYVDPYAVAEQRTAPDCSPYNDGGCPDNPCYKCGDFGATNCDLPCWPLDPAKYQSCGTNISRHEIGAFHNCFSHTETTYSITKCHQLVGWKAVAGFKNWPGRKSYLSREHFSLDTLDYCCACEWHNLDPVADTTKYLSLGGNASTTTVTTLYSCTTTEDGENCCPDPEGGPDICGPNECVSCTSTGTITQTSNASNAVHMDKFANLYVDACSSGSSGYDGAQSASVAASTFDLLASVANSDVSFNFNQYCTFYLNTFRVLGFPPIISGGGNAWHLEWTSSFSCYDHCGTLVSTTDETVITVDLTATTLDIYTFDNKPSKDCCTVDDHCQGGNGADATSCDSLNIIQTSHVHYAYTETGVLYTGDYTGIGSISFDQTYSETANGSLATPYTAKQVEDDRNQNLLSQWDIGLDFIYPWRYTDANVTRIPLVCYDEGSGAPALGTCNTIAPYTGQIKGKPIYDIVGDRIYVPDKFWDPYHKNWCICDSLVSPGCMRLYTETWGAYSTDIGVPCASQWLDNFDANQLTQGGFNGSNFRFTVPSTCAGEPLQIFDDVSWGVKYAEIIIPKQSYNYFRPCGADRFMPTGSSATHCISSLTDHTIILDATAGNITDIVNGDYVWVCGTTDFDGCWKANSDGAYTITLNEPRIVSASALPSQPIADCGTGICSKLRWQVLQPICGRVDIAQVFHPVGSMVTCSLGKPQWFVNDDEIEIVNSKGFQDINGHWKITVIDASNVALQGSQGLSTKKVYLGGGQMYSTFGPDWKWNDESSKGQYSTVQYGYNFRDVGEFFRLAAAYSASISTDMCDNVTTCTPGFVPPRPRQFQEYCGAYSLFMNKLDCDTHCLTYTDCAPAVAYFSPNEESFTNGNNHGFPSVLIDSQYGTMWHGMVKQTMTDPLFENPPCPCAAELIDPLDPESGGDGNFNCSGFEWQMDNGQCINDFTDINGLLHKFFPLVGQYEATCEIADGAPPLPPGAHIGCLKPTDFKSTTCPQGNVCSEPFADANACFDNGEGCNSYKIFPWATPWLTYLYEYNCTCNEGRFSQEYEDNGISCENAVLPPP